MIITTFNIYNGSTEQEIEFMKRSILQNKADIKELQDKPEPSSSISWTKFKEMELESGPPTTITFPNPVLGFCVVADGIVELIVDTAIVLGSNPTIVGFSGLYYDSEGNVSTNMSLGELITAGGHTSIEVSTDETTTITIYTLGGETN